MLVLSSTGFNQAILTATSSRQIQVMVMLGFSDLNVQQLGTGESPELVEGHEFESV